MKQIEGNWLYLVEDSNANLKVGFSSDLYRRLYAYRETGCRRGYKVIAAGALWVLGVRPGTREEEGEFHKAHADERIQGSEWYPFNSRAAALLMLQSWQEPPMKDRVIWTGEGPHYALLHRKTTSGLASLLSRSRVSKRGAAIVLHPCPHCSKKYGARELRHHRSICPMRTGRKPAGAKPWPHKGLGRCGLSPESGKEFHQTGFHCPVCDAYVCPFHRGAHNKQFHPRPKGKPKEETNSMQFDKAYREFSALEMVDDDPARTETVSDLVFITQFEIDLVEAGESEVDVRPHRRFVKKWGKA